MKNISHECCQQIITSLHNKHHLGRKIYCNGIISISPEKEVPSNPNNNKSTSDSASMLQEDQVPCISDIPSVLPSNITNLGVSHDIEMFVSDHQQIITNTDFVETVDKNRTQTKALLNEVKKMTTRISEYGSCISSDDSKVDDLTNDASETAGFETMNAKKRRKKKRKNSASPPKEIFLKKVNTNTSPQS